MIVDFHNHVLPDVDDGPKTVEESIDMLTFASKQGITDIVQTVHFQHPKMEGKNVEYSYLKEKVKQLQKKVDENKLNIKIYLTTENFYLPNLVEISSNPLTTVGNGRYMLIEFSTNIFPKGYEEEFFKLQTEGITPIIAHPERYRFIQNDINLMKNWKDRGYVIQIDAGSIIGHFGNNTKKITMEMIDSGFVHLIGSDAHNNKKRNFCIDQAYKILIKKYSKEIVSTLNENSKSILKGHKVINIDKKNIKEKLSFLDKLIFKLVGKS